MAGARGQSPRKTLSRTGLNRERRNWEPAAGYRPLIYNPRTRRASEVRALDAADVEPVCGRPSPQAKS